MALLEAPKLFRGVMRLVGSVYNRVRKPGRVDHDRRADRLYLPDCECHRSGNAGQETRTRETRVQDIHGIN